MPHFIAPRGRAATAVMQSVLVRLLWAFGLSARAGLAARARRAVRGLGLVIFFQKSVKHTQVSDRWINSCWALPSDQLLDLAVVLPPGYILAVHPPLHPTSHFHSCHCMPAAVALTPCGLVRLIIRGFEPAKSNFRAASKLPWNAAQCNAVKSA